MSTSIQHREVVANGIRFHVAVSTPREQGNGKRRPARQEEPSIFCLHGFPEGWISWRQMMGYLPEATIYAPDLRGYPDSDYPPSGYDVFTLMEDVRALMEQLELERPILVTHDWGGALGWLFAHQYSDLISRLVVVNCPHPRTLVRAVLTFEDFQTLRIPWVPVFQIPFLPEYLLTTTIGRKLLELSFTLREGSLGGMDDQEVRSIVARFQESADLRGPINYYRAFIRTLLHPGALGRLKALYRRPITAPTTLVWGLEDEALSVQVALKSEIDAGCPVEWRPLPGVGHFVDLEAPQLLAAEVRRLYESADAEREYASGSVGGL